MSRQSNKTSSTVHDLRFTVPVFFLFTPLRISIGDLSEWARPALFALAALASVWVFWDARGRAGFGRAAVWAWALLTLLFPPAVLPLYLAARLYTRRGADAVGAPREEDAAPRDEAAPVPESADEAEASGEGAADEGAASVAAAGPRASRRFVPTLLYTAALVCAGAAYFYADYQSFDAHLARAERAKLYGRTGEAVREYRAALRLREDAHTRKLLALELLQVGRAEEALAELRAAAPTAAPEEAIDYHTAAALGALGRYAEAAAGYRRFLAGPLCAPPSPEERCGAAGARLRAYEAETPPTR